MDSPKLPYRMHYRKRPKASPDPPEPVAALNTVQVSSYMWWAPAMWDSIGNRITGQPNCIRKSKQTCTQLHMHLSSLWLYPLGVDSRGNNSGTWECCRAGTEQLFTALLRDHSIILNRPPPFSLVKKAEINTLLTHHKNKLKMKKKLVAVW